MVVITPLFLTFTAISIGLWASIRFSVFIPKNEDEVIFDSLIHRISGPIWISASFFLVLGILGLLIGEPLGMELQLNVGFLVFFIYVCILLLMGLRRLDKIWPGRRTSDFKELLSYIKIEDYKRRMALKLYEAYIETSIAEERKRIANYISQLVII